MEQTLKITITAENRAALKGLSETIGAMNGVTVASGKAGAAVGKMGKDFTGISRVIQDLPYGFNGIANNLTQLLPAAGAAGLVVSGLVTALTFASIGFGAWTRGIGGAKNATDEMTISAKQYAEQLKVGNDEAVKSITTISKLVSMAADETATYKQKKEIIKELNKESKEYFGGLRIENGEVKGLAEAYGKYAENIYRVAKAKGAQTQIAALTTKLLSSTEKMGNIDAQFTLKPTQGLVGGVEAAKQKFAELDKLVKGGFFQTMQDIQRISELTGFSEEKVRSLVGDRAQLNAEQLRTSAQILDISKLISKEELSSLHTTEDKKNRVEEIVKSLEKELAGLKNQLDVGFINENTFNTDRIKLYTSALEALSKEGADGVDQFTRLRDVLKTLPGAPASGGLKAETVGYNSADYAPKDPFADLTPKRLSGGPMNLGGDNSDQAKKQIEDMLALQQTQAATITNLLTPAFDGLFQAMANGQNIGDQLAASFKQIVVQLTSMVIKALIFKAILSALKLSNPVTAGIDAAGSAAGGIGGALSIIGLLRGQDLQLMLDRTGTGMGYRRGG